MAKSEAQKRADANWRAKNREKVNRASQYSTAQSFIRTKATELELDELEELIKERRNFLR